MILCNNMTECHIEDPIWDLIKSEADNFGTAYRNYLIYKTRVEPTTSKFDYGLYKQAIKDYKTNNIETKQTYKISNIESFFGLKSKVGKTNIKPFKSFEINLQSIFNKLQDKDTLSKLGIDNATDVRIKVLNYTDWENYVKNNSYLLNKQEHLLGATAVYNPIQDEVVIVNKEYTKEIDIEKLLLHELTHRQTSHILNLEKLSTDSTELAYLAKQSNTLNKVIDGIIYNIQTQLSNSNNLYKDTGGTTVKDILANRDEFIAHFFTDTQFRDLLSNLDSSKIVKKSWFRNIYDKVLSWFGVKSSVLDDIYKVGLYKLINSNSQLLNSNLTTEYIKTKLENQHNFSFIYSYSSKEAIEQRRKNNVEILNTIKEKAKSKKVTSEEYIVNGKAYTRVTKFLEQFREPFNTDEVAVSYAKHYYETHKNTYKNNSSFIKEDTLLQYEDLSDVAKETLIKDVLNLWEFKRDTGTNIHKLAEDIITTYNSLRKSTNKDSDVEVIKTINSDRLKATLLKQYKTESKSEEIELLKNSDNFVNQLLGILTSYGKNANFFTELSIEDEILGVAGTIDLLVEKEDGTFDIIDFKTKEMLETETQEDVFQRFISSNNSYKAPIKHLPQSRQIDAALQLSMYQTILERKGLQVKNRSVLVVAGNINNRNEVVNENKNLQYTNASLLLDSPKGFMLNYKFKEIRELFLQTNKVDIYSSLADKEGGINNIDDLMITLFGEHGLNKINTASINRTAIELYKQTENKDSFRNFITGKNEEFKTKDRTKRLQILTTYVTSRLQTREDVANDILAYWEGGVELLKNRTEWKNVSETAINNYITNINKLLKPFVETFTDIKTGKQERLYNISLLSDTPGFSNIGNDILIAENKLTGAISFIQASSVDENIKPYNLQYGDTILSNVLTNEAIRRLGVETVPKATIRNIEQMKLSFLLLQYKQANPEVKIEHLITGTLKKSGQQITDPNFITVSEILPFSQIVVNKLNRNIFGGTFSFLSDVTSDNLFKYEEYRQDFIKSFYSFLTKYDKLITNTPDYKSIKDKKNIGKSSKDLADEDKKIVANINKKYYDNLTFYKLIQNSNELTNDDKRVILQDLVEKQKQFIQTIKAHSVGGDTTNRANLEELHYQYYLLNEAILQLKNMQGKHSNDISWMQKQLYRAAYMNVPILEEFNLQIKGAEDLIRKDFMIDYKQEHKKLFKALIEDYQRRNPSSKIRWQKYTKLEIQEVFKDLYEPDIEVKNVSGESTTKVKSMMLKNPAKHKDLSEAQKNYIEYLANTYLNGIQSMLEVDAKLRSNENSNNKEQPTNKNAEKVNESIAEQIKRDKLSLILKNFKKRIDDINKSDGLNTDIVLNAEDNNGAAIVWNKYRIPLVPASWINVISETDDYNAGFELYINRFLTNRDNFERHSAEMLEMVDTFKFQLTNGEAYWMNFFGLSGSSEDSIEEQVVKESIPAHERTDLIQLSVTEKQPETNLEVVTDMFQMNMIRKKRFDPIVSLYNAVRGVLAYRQANLGKLSKEILDYLDTIVEYIIFDKKEQPKDEGSSKLYTVAENLSFAVSFSIVAGNVFMATTETLTGMWSTLSRVLTNQFSNNGMFGVTDWTKAVGTMSTIDPHYINRIYALNRQYGIYEMDLEAMTSDRYKETRKDSIWQSRFGFWINGAAEKYFRMTILTAQMYKDGVMEAMVFDPKINDWVYDQDKDRRFIDKWVNASDKEQQLAMKYGYMSIMAEEEGLVWRETGTRYKEVEEKQITKNRDTGEISTIIVKVKKDANDLSGLSKLDSKERYKLLDERKMIRAYDRRMLEKVRMISDNTFMSSRKTDAMAAKYSIFGRLLLQMKTWIPTKIQQYWKEGGYNQTLGKYQMLETPDSTPDNKQYYFQPSWEANWSEGILQTLFGFMTDLQYYYTSDAEGTKLTVSEAIMKNLSNPLELANGLLKAANNIKQNPAKKENMLKLFNDLMLFVALTIAKQLAFPEDKDAWWKKDPALANLYGVPYKILAQSLENSAKDLWIGEVAQSLSSNTTPMVSLGYAWRLVSLLGGILTGTVEPLIKENVTYGDVASETADKFVSLFAVAKPFVVGYENVLREE